MWSQEVETEIGVRFRWERVGLHQFDDETYCHLQESLQAGVELGLLISDVVQPEGALHTG
jgi:hypothetical protein